MTEGARVAKHLLFQATTAVEKVGEIFGAFSCTVRRVGGPSPIATTVGGGAAAPTTTAAAPAAVAAAPAESTSTITMMDRWQLRVLSEAGDVVLGDEITGVAVPNPKVVKLSPSTLYVVQTRAFIGGDVMEWTAWSAPVRTRTFSSVQASVVEVGEDCARVLWDRAPRDATLLTPEVDVDAVRRVAEINGFELRVVREPDMQEVHQQQYAVGTRAATIHNLRPGTAHIVFARWHTLLGTERSWREVARLRTQDPHELTLVSRGEDCFSVSWARAAPPVILAAGYTTSDDAVYRYEITLVGEGVDTQPLLLDASVRAHAFTDLAPGAQYRVRVRCLSREGRWGLHSRVLKVTLAHRPKAVPLAVGETFATLTWTRPVEEPQEADIEWQLRSAASDFRVAKSVFIRAGAPKTFSIDRLTANTDYLLRIRTLLQGGVWGLWSEEQPIRTARSMALQLVERGESFLTVTWPVGAQRTGGGFAGAAVPLSLPTEGPQKYLDNRFELILVRVDESTGDRVTVMQEEVVKESDDGYRLEGLDPNTTYELKGRAWQRNPVEGVVMWGQYSNILRVRTLRSVALRLLSVGEDYVDVSWTRAILGGAAAAASEATEDGAGKWVDLKYELVVGCVDTGEDAVIHHEIMDTSYTITNLLPATTYMISVRACDDRGQWGAWAHAKVHTLPGLALDLHEIGETFARFVWRREDDHALVALEQEEDERSGLLLDGRERETAPLTLGDAAPQAFTIYVFSNDHADDGYRSEECGYPKGGNSEVSLVQSVQCHHSALRIADLLPDRTYTAVVRATTSVGKEGMWSRELVFHTVAPSRILESTLRVGENYIHVEWSRDERPVLRDDVVLGDYRVVSQQLRVRGLDTAYAKEHVLPSDCRELNLYGLHPGTAYTVQLRGCNPSGEWGGWSPPLTVLTRPTMTCRALEIAEDYVMLAWGKRKAPNPGNYHVGKGFVSSYHLRVSNTKGIHTDTFVVDSDCPYRISNLLPDTYFCIEMKARYNDEEWGAWSTPLWCLTLGAMNVATEAIGEEHCTVRIMRPAQTRRLPEDDGNRTSEEERALAFGENRPRCQLCLTTSRQTPAPFSHQHGDAAAEAHRAGAASMNLPVNERLVYLADVPFECDDAVHTVPNLSANTVYCIFARSKRGDGAWGMWSAAHTFITVSSILVRFDGIGESFLAVAWERAAQSLDAVADPSRVRRGLGAITCSRIKVRDSSNKFSLFEADSGQSTLTIPDLRPAETYGVSVQILSSDGTWGVWSPEALVRTVPALSIAVENVAEDAVWLSWMRQQDLSTDITANTCLNVETSTHTYELEIRGDGYFRFGREVDGRCCFVRGLRPDTVYEARVRTVSAGGQSGRWSAQHFATLPTLRVTFGNIGEHFAVIEWRRHLSTALGRPHISGLAVAEAANIIEEYRLRVELPGEEAMVYELPAHVGSFRLRDLKPSSEYRVWLCARGFEGVWGLWNQETRIRTLPQMGLQVQDIGEDYVSVSWERLRWPGGEQREGSPRGQDVKVWEIEGAVSAYRVEVTDMNGKLAGFFDTAHTTTKCTIRKLDLRTPYVVSVRAKDTYGEWGLWSEARRFFTLQPAKLNVLRVGEAFASIEWERRTRLRRLLPPVVSQPAPVKASALDPASKKNSRDSGAEYSDSEYTDSSDEMSSSGADSPTAVDAAPALVEQYSVEHYPPGVQRGNEDVRQWQVRVYGQRIFGGQTAASDDFREFVTDGSTTNTVVEGLDASHRYSVAVRAQNANGEWGRWCDPIPFETQALLDPQITTIGETFVKLQWSRPPRVTPAGATYRGCFPEPHEVHNYRVEVRPLEGERAFEDGDPNTALRTYETSQPSLQLNCLFPGSRYRVCVREQMLSETGSLLDGVHFGMESVPMIAETVREMEVVPEELGENHARIRWRRKDRAVPAADASIGVQRSVLKAVLYELHVMRLDHQGSGPHAGTMAMSLTKTFAPPEQTFELSNLVPNGVYAVTVRAQLESGHWGPWSAETRFLTLKRLSIFVESIDEDIVGLSWMRLGPDWLTDRPPPAEEEQFEEGSVEAAIARRDRTERDQADIPAGLRQVMTGDYDVREYELVVSGVSCRFENTYSLAGNCATFAVSGLTPDMVYCAHVRSRSSGDRWSMPSPKALLRTTTSMSVQAARFTEHSTEVSWFRPFQDATAFHQEIVKLQEAARLEAQQRERDARFRRQQTIQRRADVGEIATAEELAMTALEIEQSAIDATEAVKKLAPESVHMGLAEVTGFQLRLYGSGGRPVVLSNDQLQPKEQRRRRKKKHVGGHHEDEADSVAQTVGADHLLLDLLLQPYAANLKINELHPNTTYTFVIRSKNISNEWGPWSAPTAFTTLRHLELKQGLFGEQYINLFWQRPSDERRDAYDAVVAEVNAYAERFQALGDIDDLQELRDPMNAELLEELQDWREKQLLLDEYAAQLSDGRGEVICGPGLAIEGFNLRVLDDTGSITDLYVAADTHRHTLTGLNANSLYIMRLCPHYGGGVWGLWSPPLKVVTQNVLQLNLTYVGETFVDALWRRAACRSLPEDELGVVVAPAVQGRGRRYEVRLEHEDAQTGEVVTEHRVIRDTHAHRLVNLLPGTAYSVSVREWDERGAWGMWGNTKRCVTIAGIETSVAEIGEDWISLQWGRSEQTAVVDLEDPTLVQHPVEVEKYFIRVVSVADSATSMDECSHVDGRAPAKSVTGDQGEDALLTFIAAQLRQREPLTQTTSDADVAKAFAPAAPPMLREPSEGSTRYALVRELPASTSFFKITGLRQDTFYSIQLVCATTGQQLGAWTSPILALTLCMIRVRCDLIGELATRLSWARDPPRQHPGLKDTVRAVTGVYKTKTYHLEAAGAGGKNTPPYELATTFKGDTTTYRMEGLALNSVYTVRVRATDVKGRESQWSDNVTFVTHRQLRVHAGRVTEHAIQVDWARDPQLPHQYSSLLQPPQPPAAVAAPSQQLQASQQQPLATALTPAASLVIQPDKASQYHIVVYAVSDLSAPLLDKCVAGSVTTLTMSDLAPNAAYTIKCRSSSVLGEWSLWSEERTVYTMRKIVTTVAAVGEDYVGVVWGRGAPDELPDVVQGGQGGSTGNGEEADDETGTAGKNIASSEATTSDGTEDALRALQMRKKYPLLDQPTDVGPVYVTVRTAIVAYSVSVTRHGETEAVTYTVDGSQAYFTIPKLRSDAIYTVSVCACYGGEDWGLWSEPVRSATVNLLQMVVKNVGEDYVAVEWRRGLNSFPLSAMSVGRPEDTLGFQLQVCDVTTVPIGEEHTADMAQLLVRDTLVEDKMAVIRNLKPNRRYRLAVRRWYTPALTLAQPPAAPPTPMSAGAPTPTSGAADEGRAAEEALRQTIETAGGACGCWGESVLVMTLREMSVIATGIAETGLTLRWERDPNAVTLSSRQCARVTSQVNSYHVRIDEMDAEGRAPELGPSTLHIDQQFGAEDTLFKVTDLKPDTVYRVDVRCCADRVWGLWSRAALAITLPRLQVCVDAIAEDYACLRWERVARQLTAPDGTKAFTGSVGNVEHYHLEVVGLDTHTRVEKRLKASRTTFRIKHLEPSCVYAVVARSSTAALSGAQSEEWSMWSDRVVFATLKPLHVSFGRIAEHFARVAWAREEQSTEEYSRHGSNVVLGSTSTRAYHLCVFAVEAGPSPAVIDTQFRGDVTSFLAENLRPGSRYIAIARACNEEQQWGPWSEESVFLTQRVLIADMVSVGENYVAIKWRRDAGDAVGLVVEPADGTGAGQQREARAFHLCVTSESSTIDKKFSLADCTYTADEDRTPVFTIRDLRSDTKYMLSLQACYGEDDWGLWSTPIAFLTLNNLNVRVSNIVEHAAEFTWGRAQQNPVHVADPNVVVWRGTIVRYQLLLRKVEDMRAQEMRLRERAIGAAHRPGTTLTYSAEAYGFTDAALQLLSGVPPQSPTAGKEGVLTTTDPAPEDTPRPTTAPTRPAAATADEVPQYYFEQDMAVKLVKYVQTVSRIDKLEVNTEYHFQVRALDDCNEWGCWTEVFFDTPPCPPQNVVLRKDGPMVLLTWDPPTRQHRYLYCVEQAVLKDVQPQGGGRQAQAAKAAAKDAMDWRIIDTVEESVCRMRAFGPIGRIRCRIKCCKVTSPTHQFSRYSAIVSVNSGADIEPVRNLRVVSLSRETAVVEWTRADSHGSEGSGGALDSTLSSTGRHLPQPPHLRVQYRIMVGIGNQPLINAAVVHTSSFELADLAPATTYLVQVVPETDGGPCPRNPSVRFTTMGPGDRGVYKAVPGEPPLGELLPAPSDRPMPMSPDATTSDGTLPLLDGRGGGRAPRPPSRDAKGSTRTSSKSSPRPASALFSPVRKPSRATPLSSGRRAPSGPRAPGTAPHGAKRPQNKTGSGGISSATPALPAPPQSASGAPRVPSSPMTAGARPTHGGSSSTALPALQNSGRRPASRTSISQAVERFDYVGFVPSDEEK